MIELAILSPLAVAPLAALLARRQPGAVRLLALWPAALTVLLADTLRVVIADGPQVVSLPWAPTLGLSLTFNLDGLGLLFALLITGVGTLVMLYAGAYLHGHASLSRFCAALFGFMGAMLGVVLSDNLLTLFVFWELTGFTSFLLIGFEHERAESRSAALQALIVTGAGGLALLAGAVLLSQATGTVSLTTLLAGHAGVTTHAHYTAIAGLFLLAAFTKSAQTPFHFWLPNAMAAPTPVSAYLHSATMVKAGIYLVARMTPILGGTTLWTTAVITAGALTMTVGAWRAVQETDLKRILAYSTISALGTLMLLFGIGTRAAVIAALVYLVAHACYKGALFLVAGALDHETGTRDVTALSGLRRTMPYTALAAALAAGSMAGVPLFLGFVGKEAVYEAIVQAGHLGPWMWLLIAVVVAGSAVLGVIGLVTGIAPFWGSKGSADATHDAPASMWIPPLTLATIGVVTGLAPFLLDGPVGAAAFGVLRDTAPVHLHIWHGATLALGLSAVTMAALLAIYSIRRRLQTGPRPQAIAHALNPERLYSGGLAALDALSRRIAPPLHMAPLRSYVMTIVVVTAVFVGTALAIGGTAHRFRVATDVQAHDVLIVLLILGGALSAARATSSMAAVMSLGAVGWGVALMFVSFGAPDLAMTQFSVETLTVVIFVLVFRHFPKFGQVSPRLIRFRDAVIAGTFGVIMAALVLFVGTSGVSSRISGFFVEHAPTLAHGRNVVNVILVDFRALDTFGEITVLVTAAIGVSALLRLGRSARPTPAAKIGSDHSS